MRGRWTLQGPVGAGQGRRRGPEGAPAAGRATALHLFLLRRRGGRGRAGAWSAQLRKYSGERLWGSRRFGEARMGQQLWGHMSSRPDLPLERPPLSQPRRESCLRKPSLLDFRDPLSSSLISAAQGRQRELWHPKSPGSSPGCTLLSQGCICPVGMRAMHRVVMRVR